MRKQKEAQHMSDKIRVLMVDDEVQFRKTTEKILNKKGFATILAQDGQEALKKLDENPDVIILDIKMPGMDGHTVLKKIRETHADIPVIMLTGHGALPSAMDALDQGAFDYLSKPCDADLLSLKIREAFQYKEKPMRPEEKRVLGVMVPLQEYTVIDKGKTIANAVEVLRASFTSQAATSRILETGHRSILVKDTRGNIIGVLAIIDLLALIMPQYLSAPKPSTADSIQYSPLFWRGMFTQAVKDISAMVIEEVMSPVPLTIEGTASLMEAAYMMHTHKARRLLVTLSGKPAGIIREQDLFFEMEKILRS
jgi:DNA-binding response OmpR family regulator